MHLRFDSAFVSSAEPQIEECNRKPRMRAMKKSAKRRQNGTRDRMDENGE